MKQVTEGKAPTVPSCDVQAADALNSFVDTEGVLSAGDKGDAGCVTDCAERQEVITKLPEFRHGDLRDGSGPTKFGVPVVQACIEGFILAERELRFSPLRVERIAYAQIRADRADASLQMGTKLDLPLLWIQPRKLTKHKFSSAPCG